ncbi:Putative protein [Zobellia galactanivorans]|uniref:Uncharacterized protein n=1 Tax=Zobellia galactanivorans (strain DSM 12802 / CCUG 47099 / CIP 106680 / NCIMB 13871 / Dsij) TaxID=63186 RepID=G0L5U2_ZOBGA|nr:Putative protein [Zobellia galactanivorans]
MVFLSSALQGGLVQKLPNKITQYIFGPKEL